MTINKRGGYKVDIDMLINKALDTTDYIISWSREKSDSIDLKTNNVTITRPTHSPHTPSVKRKYMTNLRDTLWKMMDDRSTFSAHIGKRTQRGVYALSLNSKYDYMGQIREAVNKGLQIKYSKLEPIVSRLIKKYPAYKDDLKAMITCKAEDVPLMLRNLNAKLDTSQRLDRALAIELSKVKGMNEFIAMLKPTDTDIKLRSKNMTANRTKRKRNAKKFNYSHVKQVMEQGLASTDFYELAVAVALATGRRFIEVIHTGSFKENSYGQGFFEVSGIAKKIGKEARSERYILPCLVKSSMIIDAVERLRSHSLYTAWMESLSDLDYKALNKALNNRAALGASKAFNTMMQYPPKSLVFKDTRSIAGLIAEEKLYPENHDLWKNYDKDEFKTYYLIHDNLEEAVNYGHIDLSFTDAHDIELYKPSNKKTSRSRGTIIKNADLSALTDLEILGDKPMAKVHSHVIRVMRDNAFKLSAALIYKGKIIDGERIKFGGSRPVIKRYLEDKEVIKALQAFYTANNIE